MNIPCARPITEYGEIGSDASITITLADVVDDLPIQGNLKTELRELSHAYKNASLYIIDEVSDDVRHEGRGRYFDSRFGEHDITLYSKGVGCMNILRALTETGEHTPFGAFGPIPERYFGTRRDSRHFYDRPDHELHFPRAIGAGYTYDTNREFLHAIRIMTNLIRTESYTSLSELLSDGVTIPISTARFPGLTSHIRGQAAQELEDTQWDWSDDIEFGSVTLVTPSSQRANIFGSGSSEMEEYSGGMARALRKLYESSGAIFSPFSTHMSNFYHAPNSICPQADNADILFDLDPEKRARIFKHTIWEMLFFANADCGYRIDERAFYNELAQERIYSRDGASSLLKNFALAAEESLDDAFRPDSRLIKKIMPVKDYKRIERRRRKDSWEDVKG